MTAMTPPIISRAELSQVAFGLLTSSTIERYARIAKEGARTVVSDLETRPDAWPLVLKRSQELWRGLLAMGRRDVAEVELAVLMAALAKTGLADVDRFLTAAGLADAAPVSWLAALARQLRRERTSAMSVDVGNVAKLHQRLGPCAVRGILCTRCNLVLDKLGDHREFVASWSKRATEYLSMESRETTATRIRVAIGAKQ